MSKSPRGAVTSGALFQAPAPAHPANVARSGKSATLKPKRARVVARTAARGKANLLDAVIDGERVILAVPPKKEREKHIEIAIRVALAAAGVMVMKHHVDNRGLARTGLGIGVADLICVVPPLGVFCAIEVKRPGQKPREEQRRWLAVVERFGGVSGVATSVQEALDIVERARRVR